MICGVSGGCKLQKQALKENFPRHSETITRHPEETQCPKDLRVPKDSSVVPLPQNDDLTRHSEATTRHSERSEESKKNSHRHPGGFPGGRRVNGSEPSPGERAD